MKYFKMKTIWLFILVSILLTFNLNATTLYEVIELPSPFNNNEKPRINDNGYVVWEGSPSYYDGNTQICLYNGSTTIQLTNTSGSNYGQQINNNGEVVWVDNGPNPGIMLYDGVNTRRLSSGSQTNPQINDNGYVAWFGQDENLYSQVYYWDGSSTTQITSYGEDYDYLGNFQYLNINNRNELAWVANNEIFFYDGVETKQLTNSGWNTRAHMNEQGEVVWAGTDGSDSDIFKYDGISIIQLTDNSINDDEPQINGNGDVVWTAPAAGSEPMLNSEREIFLFGDGVITQITDNSFLDSGPAINDNGEVVWWGSDDSGHPQIFFYDGISITQITQNNYGDFTPRINNAGDIVWRGDPGGEATDGKIFLAGPVPKLVNIDIIPKTCPNECPIKGSGSVEVAILGTAGFDVNNIDIASVRLEGVASVRSSLKDKSSPVVDPQTECDCTTDGRDGFLDLCLKFDKKAIISELGEVPLGENIVLTLTGSLNDDTPIEGKDCIVFVKKGKKD